MVDMFMDVFENMFTNRQRQLLLKFLSGKTRLGQNDKITIRIKNEDESEDTD